MVFSGLFRRGARERRGNLLGRRSATGTAYGPSAACEMGALIAGMPDMRKAKNGGIFLLTN